MKVLHTLDSLNRGGAETLVLDICRNAHRFGIDLTFAATGGGDLENEFENSGAEYIRLQRDLPLDINLVWQLRKIIKERGFEIVHGYQPVELLHLYLACIGLKNVKFVLSYQGGGLFLTGYKNKLTAKILNPLIDANISCSRGLFSWIRKEVGIDTSKNFYLIYNGADPKRLEPGSNSIKAEFDFNHEDLLLGMVANFLNTNTKDQMTVCRALPKVFKEFKNAKFIFVGSIAEGGEGYFDKCVKFCDENGIGDRVFFLGKRDDIPDILNSLDLFVFSSLHEGLPLSVTEAMLAKVPMIVSDIPPLREVTDNGNCAEVFKVKNSEELSEKILKLLKNKKLRDELSRKAYQFACQNFSIEAHLQGLKTLYTELLQRKEKNLSNEDEILKLN